MNDTNAGEVSGIATIEYTVYSRKTTLPVAFGTAKECAKGLGMKYHTFCAMASRARKNREYSKKYIVVKEDPATLA